MRAGPEPFPGDVAAESPRWADGLVVRRDATGEALYASRPFDAGETVFECRRITWRPERDRDTFENPSGHHMFDPILARTAHGCDPNSRLARDLMAVIARRYIAAGERISVDYAKTETAIAHPFDCVCGAPSCRERIG